MKLLLVGQNPSCYNINSKLAFKGTKSYEIVLEWLKDMEIYESECAMINAFHKINQKYGRSEFDEAVTRMSYYVTVFKPKKVISLGKIAAKVLKKAGVEHFELPHPSGKNRKLNDKEWLKKELKKTKEYVWK